MLNLLHAIQALDAQRTPLLLLIAAAAARLANQCSVGRCSGARRLVLLILPTEYEVLLSCRQVCHLLCLTSQSEVAQFPSSGITAQELFVCLTSLDAALLFVCDHQKGFELLRARTGPREFIRGLGPANALHS